MNSVKPAPPAIQAEAPEDESEALFRLERPSLLGKSVASDARLTAGDSWEWSFPASLLRMMMNPIGGGTEPVARRAHPLGFVSLAAAIHAAAQLFRGARPAHADVRWLRLAQGRSDFRLICKLKSFDNSRIFLESIFLKADAELAQVKLTLDRQPGESAGLVLTDEGEQPE
ncbi:MAG TPA: hypothetical protein VFQ92_21210, partial [Blastocatellia bacterium]|nr:hypothetical protein [Blastocatellia bacterium]